MAPSDNKVDLLKILDYEYLGLVDKSPDFILKE